MFSVEVKTTAHDPIDQMTDVLDAVWDILCHTYDVAAEIPRFETLFMDVDLSDSQRAAESVLARMLCEISESTHRFSPWYKSPARAFGLVIQHDAHSQSARPFLAPEAVTKWRTILYPLRSEIDHKRGLIKALLVFNENAKATRNCAKVIAQCKCVPPNKISIRAHLLVEGGVVCEVCNQSFSLVDSYPLAD